MILNTKITEVLELFTLAFQKEQVTSEYLEQLLTTEDYKPDIEISVSTNNKSSMMDINVIYSPLTYDDIEQAHSCITRVDTVFSTFKDYSRTQHWTKRGLDIHLRLYGGDCDVSE